MVKKNLLVALFGLILMCVVSVSALENLGTFEQNEVVRVTQVCNNANYITVSSISYPNTTTALENINMTYSGSGEFFIDFNLSSQLGRHDVRGVSDGCENTFATWFEITPTGNTLTEASSTLLLSSFIILIFATIFFLVFGILTRNIPFKIFFVGLSILFMVGTIGFSVSVWQQMFGSLGNLVDTYGRIFVLLMGLLTAAGMGLILYLIYFAFKSFYRLKGDDEYDD